MNPQENSIEWSALFHDHGHKDPDWFWGIGIAAVAIGVIAIFAGNPLFALLIMIGTITLFMHALKTPRAVKIVADTEKITVEGDMFSYEELDSFCVFKDEEKPVLVLKTKRVLNPRVVLPLDLENIGHIRAYLVKHLPEKKLEMPLSHRFLEFLGL